eukprot:4075082-Pyramimonas_sp.AAC.1
MSACRIQSSELCLLSELGPRSCSYCSSHPERCCGFSALHLARAVGGLQGWYIIRVRRDPNSV